LEQIAGRYEVQSIIGKGAMGVVMRCRDTELDRIVAVKKLRLTLDVMDADEALDRFRSEARVAASLNHPNIVAVHDLVRDGPDLYLVMEHIPGPTLREVIVDRGPLNVDDALLLGRDVASALCAAHMAGVIHRDVKPDNVFLSRERAKLGDFGLARPSQAVGRTAVNVLLGTPQYLAPELVRDVPASPSSDVFAFALTMLFALRGSDVFRGDDPTLVVYSICTQRIHIESELDSGIDRLLDSALDHDPAQRPTSIALTNAFEKVLTARGAPREEVPAPVAVGARSAQPPAASAGTLAPTPPLDALLTPPAPPPGSTAPAVPHIGRPQPGAPNRTTAPGRRRSRRRWPWVALAGALVLAVTLAGALLLGRSGQSPTGTPASSSAPTTTVPTASPSPLVLPATVGPLVSVALPPAENLAGLQELFASKGYSSPEVAGYGLRGGAPSFVLLASRRGSTARAANQVVDPLLGVLASRSGGTVDRSMLTTQELGAVTYTCLSITGRRPQVVCSWLSNGILGIGIASSGELANARQLSSQAEAAIKG
jgi:eukaryotic-like serine/threonine-protein kinase